MARKGQKYPVAFKVELEVEWYDDDPDFCLVRPLHVSVILSYTEIAPVTTLETPDFGTEVAELGQWGKSNEGHAVS